MRRSRRSTPGQGASCLRSCSPFAAIRTKLGAAPKFSSPTRSPGSQASLSPAEKRFSSNDKNGASHEKRIFLAPPFVACRLRGRLVGGRHTFDVPSKRGSIAGQNRGV